MRTHGIRGLAGQLTSVNADLDATINFVNKITDTLVTLVKFVNVVDEIIN